MSTALRVVSFLCLFACVSAQALVLPQCAQGCANEAAIQVGCSLSDPACLCKTAFTSTVVACSKTTSCSMTEQGDVSAVLQAMCGAASSVPSSFSGTGSSPSSTPPASSTSAPLSMSSSTVVPPFSPPLSLPSSTSGSGSSTAASATAPPSGSSSSSAPSSTSSTGAASRPGTAVSIALGVGIFLGLVVVAG